MKVAASEALRNGLLPARKALAFALILLFPAAAPDAGAFDPETLPQVGCHPDGISYWSSVLFADGMHHAGSWLEYDTDWGTTIPHWNVPQFDGNGCPRYNSPGKNLRAIVYGLHNPANSGIYNGQWVIAWRGSADVRFGGTFVAAKSSCPATGRCRDGRRVYLIEGSTSGPSLTVRDIDPEDPITALQAWLPDPADPLDASLEGKIWHPKLLERRIGRNYLSP